MNRESRPPTTYHQIGTADASNDDDAKPIVTGLSPKPFGHDLPGPAWAADPTGKEPPLGEDINALPDMEACWWIPGAKSPRAKAKPQLETEADDEPQSD